MSGQTPCLRASYALRTSWNRQILIHMENFPTPKLSAVPRIANALTIAFLAGTTWWSSAQRPIASEPPIALKARQTTEAATPRQLALPADAHGQAVRTSLGGNVAGDAIVTVGFNSTGLR